MKLNRKLVVGSVAGLAVLGGGAAFAASQFGDPKQDSQAIINDAAQQLGVQPSALSDALEKAFANRIDAAVAAGRLTKEEGDAIKARIQSGGFPFFFGGGPPHFMHDFRGLDAAASYLGLTQAELRTKLENGKSLADVAKEQGKSVDGLIQALVDDAKKHLDQAVKDGRLTESQEQSILSDIKARITDFVNGNFPPMFRHGPGPFFGFGGLDAAASYLGLTQAELRTKLENGKSLADVAKEQGKSVDGLIQALVDNAKKRLDQAVKDGRLTESEEQSILSDIKARITDLVNLTFSRGFGPGGPGFGFRFGFGGPGDRGFPGPGGPPAFGPPAGSGWGPNA